MDQYNVSQINQHNAKPVKTNINYNNSIAKLESRHAANRPTDNQADKQTNTQTLETHTWMTSVCATTSLVSMHMIAVDALWYYKQQNAEAHAEAMIF